MKLNNITFKELQETWVYKLHSGKILELWQEFVSPLPLDLQDQLRNANYTLYNAGESIKKDLKVGQVPFVFEVPYESDYIQDKFNEYAAKFIIVMNLI